MRGDLLPQAVQEWDIVLTANPDRLDARTGLLETYWREGNFDQVEQLAKQILHDIPHCLKALLLLAHVTFAQDALQAQDLMRQAEALDPDQDMAQELFVDLIASQPQEDYQTLQNAAPFSNWGGTGTTDFDNWSTFNQQDNLSSQPANNAQTSHTTPQLDNRNVPTQGASTSEPQVPELETWRMQPGTHEVSETSSDSNQVEQQAAWYHMDAFSESTADPWSSASNSNQVTPPTSLDMEEEESDLPAPPVWLDMLTRVDQRKSSGSLSQVPPYASALEKEAVTVQQPVQQPVEPPPFHPVATPCEQLHVSSSSHAAQEEEEFFFGPEWL